MEDAPVVPRPGRDRVVAAALALTLLPVLFLVDTYSAVLRGWRLASRFDVYLFRGAAVYVAVVLLALCVRPIRLALARHAARLVLANLLLIGVWGVIEVVLRLSFPTFAAPFHLYFPGSRMAEANTAVIPGIEGDSHVTINSAGLRGTEMPPKDAAYRILCIGASTTICDRLDDKETWAHLLMERLNDASLGRRYWVGNGGQNGVSTIHHLKFIEESPLVREMDCVVFLCGIGDLLRYLKGETYERLEMYEEVWAPYWTRTRLRDLMRRVWRKYVGTHDIAIEDSTGAVYARRRALRHNAPQPDGPTDFERGLRNYRTRLESIIAACRTMNVRPVFLTQPVLWNENISAYGDGLLWLGENSKGEFLSVKELRQTMDRYNDVQRAVCAEQGVGNVELSSVNDIDSYYYDDAHFTEAGAREVARLAAEWFIAQEKSR